MRITSAECRRAIRAIHIAIEGAQTVRPPDLRRRFVFVGGGLAPLLITDPEAPAARPTKDVDVVFAVTSAGDYSFLRQDLLNAGFYDDITMDKPASALFLGEWRVDFLTATPGILDPGNRWFPSVLEDPVEEPVDGVVIWRASLPSWLATKFEAWQNRGRLSTGAPDYFHHDLEDIIAVLDGRAGWVDEVAAGVPAVREFILDTFSVLASSPDFQSALPGHTGGHERAVIVMKAIRDVLRSFP